MSLDMHLVSDKNCTTTIVYWNRAYAIREWITSAIGVPVNGDETIEIDKYTLQELLESCNAILADRSLAESLIPINTNDFDTNQDYDKDYFDQIEETQEQLNHLFETWNWKKPLYYYEWY
jgi:hypothetical protein